MAPVSTHITAESWWQSADRPIAASALDGKAPGYLTPYGAPCKALLGLNAMLDGSGKRSEPEK